MTLINPARNVYTESFQKTLRKRQKNEDSRKKEELEVKGTTKEFGACGKTVYHGDQLVAHAAEQIQILH